MRTTEDTAHKPRRTNRRWRAMVAMVVTLAIMTLMFAPTARAQSDEESDEVDDVLSGPLSLEPLDPVVDDTVVPDVLVPAGDLLAPVGNNTAGLLFDDNYHAIPPPPFGPNLWLSNIVAGNSASAAELLLNVVWGDAHTYFFEAGWTGPAPSFDSNLIHQTGTVGVPLPVDLSGNGLYDIAVEVRHVATTPVLRVIRLPGAPSPLTASVHVMFAPFGDSVPDRVGLTLFALDFPAMAEITLTDPGFESRQLVAKVRTVDPGESLRVGAQYRYGSGSNDFIRLDETLSPVPDEVTLTS